MNMTQIIRTNIKFKKNERGSFYGFVTKTEKGSWRGVRESDGIKKKIVFVDPMAENGMVENMLYHCTLVPMTEGDGFIVMNASAVHFKAKIETHIDGEYYVKVSMGYKSVIYEPGSDDPRKNNMQVVADMLRKRNDLTDAMQVADDFLDAATLVLMLYKKNKRGVEI